MRRGLQQLDRTQLRITKVCFALLCALVGLSLVYAMSGETAQARMSTWLVPSSDAVWREGKVWTLLTGPFLEPRILSLIFEGLMIWMLLPSLERWWGPRRFGLFVAATALGGTVAGSLVGLALDDGAAVLGLNPTLFGGAIAFGVLYARQPVQFFGVLPMTGRQFMFGMIAITALFVLLGQEWAEGAAMGTAMLIAAGLASGRLDPIATWRRWRYARARAHLRVMPPDVSTMPKRSKTDERYLN